MWSFVKKYKNAILNVFVIAGPVVAGVISGGILTAPVLIAAGVGLAGKLAASPLNHSATLEDGIATAAQLEAALKAAGVVVPPKPVA